jgi:asparagine synthase (glutamine-hydrolysing)
VSLEDGVFDESQGAALVARQYGTDHHVLVIKPDMEITLPKLVRAYDQPFADASAVPSLCISEEARKFVKVVINGEGGDELFGGYRRHLAMMLYDRYRLFIDMVPDSFFNFLNQNLPQPQSFRSNYAFLHRYLRGLGKNPFDRYVAWCVDGFDEREKEALYRVLPDDRLPSRELLADKSRHYGKEDPFDQFMTWDFFLNMHDDMLVKMDIATMTYGLEGRNPFLDHRLIEWAFHLPRHILLKDLSTKPILRALAKRYLPESVAMAPKRGFEIPLIRWLREDLHDMVHDVCLSQRSIILELFNRSYVEELLAEKLPMDPDRWSKRVWIIFMLAMWGKINEDRVFLS